LRFFYRDVSKYWYLGEDCIKTTAKSNIYNTISSYDIAKFLVTFDCVFIG